ncbi:glutaredoxin domain-containing protein [Blumeria hordei DH14]|uniref:Glutaredoxin-like protein n=1 Tax=Blumeria graminis f. sp. hordei (strain DH14) TaxID=546991 RepID=N1JFV3_BLUG1|nr:glutaredoxin domain-containing protein [Blumeria hordei DH14]
MIHSVQRSIHSIRITLFTRVNCSLCVDAKKTLAEVQKIRPFEYREINVMDPESKDWRDIYEFDTPVECAKLSSHAQKLMHRFKSQDVVAKMVLVETKAG